MEKLLCTKASCKQYFWQIGKGIVVLQIRHSKQRKQIQSCLNCPLGFYYSKNINKLDYLLEEFKKGREGVVDDAHSASAKNVYKQN